MRINPAKRTVLLFPLSDEPSRATQRRQSYTVHFIISFLCLPTENLWNVQDIWLIVFVEYV